MKRNVRVLVAANAVLFAVAMVSTGHAQPIPTDGITATAYVGANSNDPMLAVNGSGLSGVYPDEVHSHDPWNTSMWYSDAPSVDDIWYRVDLGQSYNLAAIRVWTWNGEVDPELGVETADIYYSNDAADPGIDFSGAGWTLLGAETFNQAPGTNGYGPPDDVVFGVAARWVGIDILTAFDYPPGWAGLSEVQFVEVPEPSTAVLAGLGLLSLAVWGWRRRH